jgi:hypothetical protein
MTKQENVVICECSTNLVLVGEPTNWVSNGYDEGWANNTYDRSNKYKLPYPIEKAYYTDAELNVSKLKEGAFPCVMGRVIALNGHPIWSVVVFVDYGKDERGRGVPVYRLFFCEGNNLRRILDRVYRYEQVNGRLPFFDPFMTNGFLNDYQDSNIDLEGLIHKNDAIQATSELDRRLLVLPHGTFDVDGGVNALSLLKLHLLTKQRAIAQAKNADPNAKVDKITKIAWAYNADVVLENAGSYGLIQAYDDDAYQVLIKKGGKKLPAPKPVVPTSIDNEGIKVDVDDKPWHFLTILKEAVSRDFPDGFDTKPITDSFNNLIKHKEISQEQVESNKDILLLCQKELEAINVHNSLYTFVKIAKQCELDNAAFQRGNDIKAIRLYILICILFPFNIEQQQKDINLFRNNGHQADIDLFIKKLRECSISSRESSQKIIEIGFRDIFAAQKENIEQVADNVRWLWTASPWSHPDLLENVRPFLRDQILLVEANKPQEVSPYFQFLNGLYDNDLKGKTNSLRDTLNLYPFAIKPYQFEWKLWEIDKIKSRKRDYSDFYKQITQNCLTRGSTRCQSLVLLLDKLRGDAPLLDGAYSFFANISDNGQYKILEYQPDPEKDISKWVIDRTDLLAFAEKNKEESSRNYNYARIYNAVSSIVMAIPRLIKEILIAVWELLVIIVNGLIYLIADPNRKVFGRRSRVAVGNPPRPSDQHGDRLAWTLFKIWLTVIVIAGGIVLWGFAKDRAIDKVVEKLPEIDQSFTKILNNESEKFFRRYQPKPDRCDIILANSELYSGCNINFTQKGDESTKIKIASTLVDQGFVSWRIDLFGDGKFKIDYNITTEKVTNSFKQKYQETPYPSLIDKLGKDDYFNNNSSEQPTKLSIAYFEDLNQGKYKYYDLVSGDKIAKDIYTVLGVEDYRKKELVNAIYRYQVKDINLFIDGKIPKGTVVEKDPTSQKTKVKTPADDTYESIKLRLRRNLNQDLREKFTSDENLKKEFEALKKKAEDGFTVYANPKQVETSETNTTNTTNTTKSALNKIVDTLKKQCNPPNQGQAPSQSQIEEAIVAELTSASPEQKNDNKIDLTKAIDGKDAVVVGKPNDRTRLIAAIFDYQIGSVNIIKVNRQVLPISANEQGEDKEVLSGWDGIINLNGGVFNKVMENVSKQLGCQKKNDVGGGDLPNSTGSDQQNLSTSFPQSVKQTLEKFWIPQIP